jgi:hypothetical protein
MRDIVETNSVGYIRNEPVILSSICPLITALYASLHSFMFSNLRLVYRLTMEPLTTQFVDYKVGGPEGMFLSERQINVQVEVARSKRGRGL